ncbi:MAG: hypothetical protein AAFP69_19405, partial [Planctomycetota bacterium]
METPAEYVAQCEINEDLYRRTAPDTDDDFDVITDGQTAIPNWLPKSRTPVQLVTRFKLNGLAKLLGGIEAHEMVIRAIAAIIDETVQLVLRTDARSNEQLDQLQILFSPEQLAMWRDDPDSLPLRAMILDSQGVAEITVVCRSNNYSLPTLILHQIRSMEMSLIFECQRKQRENDASNQVGRNACKDDKESMPSSEDDCCCVEQPDIATTMERTADFMQQFKSAISDSLNPIGTGSDDRKTRGDVSRLQHEDCWADDMANNHVFSSSYTTACITNASDASERDEIYGPVESDITFVVSPGHLADVDNKLAPSRQKSDELSQTEFYRVRFGKNDLEYRVGQEKFAVVNINSFIASASEVYDNVASAGSRGSRETGVNDLACVLSVPIPKWLARPEKLKTQIDDRRKDRDAQQRADGDCSHVPVVSLLSIISQTAGRTNALKQGDLLKPERRWFDQTKLSSQLRKAGIPKRLRDSLVYLFMNFFQCLNDPQLFDSILDLYDAFITLHQLLKDCVDDVGTSEQADFQGQASLKFEESDLYALEDFATALEDACYYRLSLTSPHKELNDMAVHFRGGLNQLLAGADVLLKSGVGFFRRECRSFKNPDMITRRERRDVGVATEMCFSLVPRCFCSRLAVRKGKVLAHLKVNKGHVFQVGEFAMYYHEVGHLIQWALGYQEIIDQEVVPRSSPDQEKAWAVWSEEIFAEAFVYCQTCAFDRVFFMRQLLSVYSRQATAFV